MHRSTLGFARTRLRTVAAGLLLLSAACGYGSAPPPPPAPAPPPVTLPAVPPVAEVAWRDVMVCVVDEEGIRDVPARYNPVTHDTLVDGRPYAEVFPLTASYAQEAEWYINNEQMKQGPFWYGRYGLPRYTLTYPLKRIGDYRGAMLFAEVQDAGDPYSALYVAVRPDCAFQPYSGDWLTSGVRG